MKYQSYLSIINHPFKETEASEAKEAKTDVVDENKAEADESEKQSMIPYTFIEEFQLKKQVCTHIFMDKREIKVIGSLWNFTLCAHTSKERQFIQFLLEIGK